MASSKRLFTGRLWSGRQFLPSLFRGTSSVPPGASVTDYINFPAITDSINLELVTTTDSINFAMPNDQVDLLE